MYKHFFLLVQSFFRTQTTLHVEPNVNHIEHCQQEKLINHKDTACFNWKYFISSTSNKFILQWSAKGGTKWAWLLCYLIVNIFFKKIMHVSQSKLWRNSKMAFKFKLAKLFYWINNWINRLVCSNFNAILGLGQRT